MNYNELLDKIIEKQRKNVKKIGVKFPYNDVDGEFQIVPDYAWTNGFYPGLLWLAYLASREEIFKTTAISLEERLDGVINSFTMAGHDVGFIWLLSSGINYKQNKNEDSRTRLLNMATYLAGRFNIAGNYIRAWDGDLEIRPKQAIIDCMMNLPLLFWASRELKDPRFSHIAKAHAETVIKHFIDEDGAVRHICCFNPETGEFIESMGGQGYSNTSAWSRGASWAIYGFAMMYRYTKCEKYLEVSKKVAKFFIENIKEDYVPAWDFRAPNNDVKDSSAGAIAASGLLEIFTHTNDIYYKEEAEKIVSALAQNCMTGEEREAVLDKATAHLPVNENVEVGLIYADYYFTEAVYKLAMDEYSLPWE